MSGGNGIGGVRGGGGMECEPKLISSSRVRINREFVFGETFVSTGHCSRKSA